MIYTAQRTFVALPPNSCCFCEKTISHTQHRKLLISEKLISIINIPGALKIFDSRERYHLTMVCYANQGTSERSEKSWARACFKCHLKPSITNSHNRFAFFSGVVHAVYIILMRMNINRRIYYINNGFTKIYLVRLIVIELHKTCYPPGLACVDCDHQSIVILFSLPRKYILRRWWISAVKPFSTATETWLGQGARIIAELKCP